MSIVIQKQKILIQTIIDYFGYFSESGQNRLLQDLKRTNNQYLCFQFLNEKKVKSVSKIGVPTVKKLKNNIKQQRIQIDQDVNWSKTSGKLLDNSETSLGFKKILELSEIIYKETRTIEPIKILLSQLTGNKLSIIRGLAQIKYQSSTPGKRLVGKQTKTSKNNNLGFVEEHVLPTKAFIKYFTNQIENNHLKITNIDKVLTNYFIVNLNTDDDYLLSKNGFKNSMPKDWNIVTDDPFMRYKEAGIQMETILPITTIRKNNGLEHKTKSTIIQTEEITNKVDYKNVCKVALKTTYYNNDFFNIKIDYSSLIVKTNSQIKIDFNNIETIGLIDRKANNNKAPRIRNIGKEYKEWIKNSFELNDTLYVQIFDTKHIKLFHKKDFIQNS
tara:strand:+ start:39382 stop:40539 length:1158 start_codon:yes stop_codon:yes gene_type:complete